MRNLSLIAAITLFALALSACGSYVPVQEGQCKPGRTWVSPSQDADGNWRAGYCKDN